MSSRIRSCNFGLVLYPDDLTHLVAMDVLEKNGYQYSAILHDADLKEDGSKLGDHFHVVLCFPRQKDLSALAKELDVAPNYIEPIRNRVYAERYLVHADNPEKAQYDPSKIFGTLAENVRAHICSGKTEEDKVRSLLALLDTMPKPCSYRRFLQASCDANLYSTFRRMGFVLKELMDEHNGWGIYDNS